MNGNLLLVIAPLFIASIAAAQRPPPQPLPPETYEKVDGWYTEFAPAQAEARKLGMDMLIDFGGSDWCAPCAKLKRGVFIKEEFIAVASKKFVLVDIDDLSRGLSPERKARYVELEKQYGIKSFPSVILATPEGLAYAWTTYADKTNTPEAFWASLQPLISRGEHFRTALADAQQLKGRAKAERMIEGMALVRPDFLWQFHSDKIEALRKLDPEDRSGFLASLDARKAVSALEYRLSQSHDVDELDVDETDVDALITKHRLKGEMLQQAEVMRAVILTLQEKPLQALEAFGRYVAAEKTRTKFDHGDFVPSTPEALAAISELVTTGCSNQTDLVAQYFALHHIFEHELPDRFEISCGHNFRPEGAMRRTISELYPKALIEATASLPPAERAEALKEGLARISYVTSPSLTRARALIAEQMSGADKPGG
jgi:thioredoxin-related protein